MVNWLKNIWKRIQESNDTPLLDKIEKLKSDLVTANKELFLKAEEISEKDATIEDHEQTIKELESELAEASLTRKPLDYYFKEKKTKYTWKPGKRIYLHKTLENFSKDLEYQEKYLAFLKTLGLKDSYKDIATAVYQIVVLVQKYINKTLSDDYKSDKEVFGVGEYWLSPREAFDQYVLGELASDCEDTSAFLYGSIVAGLNYLGFDVEDRLIRVDINFPVGHAVVAYQKENGVWACIESTYGEQRFSKNWVRDKDMFRGVYTGIWHIFNEKTEYSLR